MQLRPAEEKEFEAIRDLYWALIDKTQGRNDTVCWQKGVYPSDDFLFQSIDRGELYVLAQGSDLYAAVVMNSDYTKGYEDLPWGVDCSPEEVVVLHALAVHPAFHRQGIGSAVIRDAIGIAKKQGKKAVRLDILKQNLAAKLLYTRAGFKFVAEKKLFYADTGLTDFLMYEQLL